MNECTPDCTAPCEEKESEFYFLNKKIKELGFDVKYDQSSLFGNGGLVSEGTITFSRYDFRITISVTFEQMEKESSKIIQFVLNSFNEYKKMF